MVGDDGPSVSRIRSAFSESGTLEKIEEKQSSQNIGVSRFKCAIAWLIEHLDDCPRPIIPYIKQAYGLDNANAVEAVRLARLKRG